MRRTPVGQTVGAAAFGVIPLMVTVLMLMLVSGCARGPSLGHQAGPPCDQRMMKTTTDFASRAGRIAETSYGIDDGPQDVCYVFLLVPKGAGPGPLEIIDEGVRLDGWERKGDRTWVNPHGFEVTARDDSGTTDPNAPQTAEYEISLWGTAAK